MAYRGNDVCENSHFKYILKSQNLIFLVLFFAAVFAQSIEARC